MSRTTFNGYLRQRGSGKAPSTIRATPGVMPGVIYLSFSATQAQGTPFVPKKYFPKGGVIIGAQSLGGGVGGASPTVDIGFSGANDAIANELLCTNAGNIIFGGTGATTAQTTDREIVAGVGLSAAASGTVRALVYYIMQDDGSEQAKGT